MHSLTSPGCRIVVSSFRKFAVRHLTALCLLVFGIPFLLRGQEASIVGTVTDPSGSVVPNVKITATTQETGVARSTETNDAGQYVLPDIHIGHYIIKAEVGGFKTGRKDILLQVGDRTRIDFQMQVGATTETITVEANEIRVQTDSSEQSSLLTSKQITELATNGRTIYTYVALTPGAASLMPDTQNPVPVGGNANVSFNGERVGHNLYLLDGGENSDRGGAGASSIMPSIDAISETQTLTSNYSADYGLSSGGTVTSVVKSGTKAIHASAWEFFRNDALDARGFFNPAPQTVGKLRYNIFGFNVGGPVTLGKLYNPEKTKTFFFYNMEWRRINSGGSPINQQVPLPATYGGDFSSQALTLADLHAPFSCQLSAQQQAAFATAGQALSGCTNGAPDTTKEVAFNKSAIPTGLLDSDSQALLTAGGPFGGIFPGPTSGNRFIKPVAVPTNVKEEIVRLDENVTSKFTIFGHFVAEQITQNFATSMWSGDNVPSVGNSFNNPSYAAVVHTAYSISPSVVNEVAFNYNGNRIHILPAGLVSAPSSYTFHRFFGGPNVSNRIPSIQLNGSTGTNYTVNWMPWNNLADDYQIRDDLSWTRGRHQFRVGGSWALYKKTQDWFKNTQGNFQFNGSYTGNDFADFLLGYASNYTEDAVKRAGQWNNNSWALYFQDNWRVNNRLTLNLGLRWDGIPHTYEANYYMNNFFPQLYNLASRAVLNPDGNTVSPLSPGLGSSPDPILAGQQFYVNGVATCGRNGTPRGCVDDSWKNFQPRIGFAYDLFGNAKTIIRGGLGIMNERIQGNDVYDNSGTVPLAASINFNNVLSSDPRTGIAGGTSTTSIPVNNVTGLDDSNYAAPRSTQFSFGVQQSISKSVLSLAYVGTQNRHQSFRQEIDLVDPGLLPAYVAKTAATPYNSNVLFPGYHSLRIARNQANGDYNAIQASFRGSWVANNLQYQVMYTYSHTNDAYSNTGCAGGSDLCSVSNPYLGWKYDFGPANFDIHNIFNANFVYDLSFFRHSANRLQKTMLGGWEISGIITAVSGAPINLGLNGNSASSVVPNSTMRPDQTGTGHDPHTVDQWFDTSVYSAPACTTATNCWGNTKHNSVVGPGRHNWNVSLFKNFVFSESRGSMLQFRAEFFNVWNHTQFNASTTNGGISNNLGAGDFGRITQAYDPRIIQLALKLYF
jgi:hypothetical protein